MDVAPLKILVIVVTALVFLFAACGGSTSTATPVPTPSVPVAPTGGQTPSAEATPPSSAQPGSGQATLELRVTDAPPEGVSKIEITVGSVEVNRAEGPSPVGWETVISEPQTFDLVQLEGIEALLGSSQLEPGRINQIRLEIVEATITLNGEDLTATVPSGRLRLVGSFELSADETTVVTLDFDADKSVVLRGNMNPLIRPVVKLLVRSADDHGCE